MQSVPQVSQAYATFPAPPAAPAASALASPAESERAVLEVVWYMELRSSREAGAVVDGAGLEAGCPLVEACGWVGLVPGCRDCKPRGVSRITRKWPVKGGARVAGRASGSICEVLNVEQKYTN